MKRIVMSLGTLVFAAAVVVGGTGAFFSDTETSEGNVFTAGSVTLLVTDIEHTYNNDANNAPEFTYNANSVSFELDDLKPLDEGSIDYTVLNGQNEAYVCAMVTETGNSDNNVVNPESDLGDDANEGELGDFLSFNFSGNTGTLADISGVWQTVGTVNPLTPTNSIIDYCFGDYDGAECVLSGDDDNLAQTDSLTADIEFYAVQTRNNPDFTCADLNPTLVLKEDLSGDNLAFNQENKDNGHPYIEWEIDGTEITIDFVNPTTISQPFPFDYRLDNSAATFTGVTGVARPAGAARYPNVLWGDFYTFVSVPAGSTETRVLNVSDELLVRLFIGPERDYDFDWIVFETE